MTEQEWLAIADPRRMLAFAQGKASDRKSRLFAAACCRRIWHLLQDVQSREAVELAERYAEGIADTDELEEAFQAAADGADNAREAVAYAVTWDDHQAAEGASDSAAYAADEANPATVPPGGRWGPAGTAERAAQAALLRDILGNPFRPPSPLPAGVLAWNDATVLRLAQGIYEERAFERLPILADALVDAGCEQEELIGHCRSEWPHSRGC